MAIDKARTSPAMKAGVIILIAAFVLGIAVIGIGGLTSGGGGSAPSQQTSDQTAAALRQIGQSAMASITPAEDALKAKPNDYDLLKALGDQYYDYAQRIGQIAPGAGLDVTIWRQAVGYYERALAVKPGDPSVGTDMAIAQFYSGDTSAAVATAEKVRKSSPSFAPAAFNSGVFYQSSGENAKAIAAFQEYLRLEPNGPSASSAKQLLSQLQSGGGQPQGSTAATGQ